MDAKVMAKTAFDALDEKKAQDIKVIGISEISTLADYFIIASADNSSQLQACVRNVEEKMHEAGFVMKRVEGNRSSSWILMDFGDIVVHLFDPEDRLFYDLERIWCDGELISPEEL